MSAMILAGLALSKVLPPHQIVSIGVVLIVIGMCLKPARLLTILLCIVLLASYERGAVFTERLHQYSSLWDTQTSLQVTAKDDGVYGKGSQLEFTGGDVTTTQGVVLPGTIAVSGYGVNQVYQGDVLYLEGKLRPSLGNNVGRMSFAKLELVERTGSFWGVIRRTFAAGILSVLPEPSGSFAMGLLVGMRATLPDDVKESLLVAGLTHIIAVSGFNLTIMLEASKKLFAKASKVASTLFAFGLMLAFACISGFGASITRAALVSSLSISLAYYGRAMPPLTLITFAAALTAYANPPYVWGNVSWYLSFLAFFGIVIVSPILKCRAPPKLAESTLGSVLIDSVSAELVTLPYLLHTFGQMSFIGLLGNAFVATLVPLAMATSFIAGLAGLLIPGFAGWFAWPAKYILSYMLGTSAALANLPHAFADKINFSLWTMLSWYLVLGLCLLLLHFKDPSKNGTITDKNC